MDERLEGCPDPTYLDCACSLANYHAESGKIIVQSTYSNFSVWKDSRHFSKKCIRYSYSKLTVYCEIDTRDWIVDNIVFDTSMLLYRPPSWSFNRAQSKSLGTSRALSGDYIPCSFDVIEHACLDIACTSKHLGDTAGSVLLFRASTPRTLITTTSSHLSVVTKYRSSNRHRAIALLASSLFETYHTSLLHARRHICSNPRELLKTHLCIHRYWPPCVWSSLGHLWRASRKHTKLPRSRLCCHVNTASPSLREQYRIFY